MQFFAVMIPGICLLLTVITIPVFCQDVPGLRLKPGSKMSTTTITYSSPKITRTKTTWVTTPSPIHPPYTTKSTLRSTPTRAATPADPSNTTILSPSTIHRKPSTHASGKLIGLLFALGAILVVVFIVLLVFCHRRHRKVQQKRVADWIELNGLHDRSSVLGNCGTPAGEQAVFRGLEKKQEEEKRDAGVNHEFKTDMMGINEPLQVPGKALTRIGKTSSLYGTEK